MAITRRADQSNNDQLNLDINNGDLAALRAVQSKFNLASEEAVLRFALAVFVQAKNDTIYIEDLTGTKTGLQPSDQLRRINQDGQN